MHPVPSALDACRRSGAPVSLLRRVASVLGVWAWPWQVVIGADEEELARCRCCSRMADAVVGMVCRPGPPLGGESLVAAPEMLLLLALLRRRSWAARAAEVAVAGGGGGRRALAAPLIAVGDAVAAAAVVGLPLPTAACCSFSAAAAAAALKRATSAFHPTCGVARVKSRSLGKETRRGPLGLAAAGVPSVLALARAAKRSLSRLRSACIVIV